MQDRIIELLIALGAGGVLVETVRTFFQRKKMGADYADVIAKTAIGLLEPLERRIDELEEELELTKKELRNTKAELNQTKYQLKEARSAIRKMRGSAIDDGNA